MYGIILSASSHPFMLWKYNGIYILKKMKEHLVAESDTKQGGSPQSIETYYQNKTLR